MSSAVTLRLRILRSLSAYNLLISPGPSLVIFVSVILGVALLGPIGGLFAIPATGCAKILLVDYLDNRNKLKAGDTPKTIVEKVKHKVSKAVS